MARRPKLIQIMRKVAREKVAQIHTSLPATVVDYDAHEQQITARPAVAFSREDPETGERETYEPPVIPNVPVLWRSGSDGQFAQTWPLQPGDEVWLHFAERSIDEWVLEDGEFVVPQDARRFNITDAVAEPARSSAPLDAEAISDDAMVLFGDLIRLGSSSADDFVALASLVLEQLEAIQQRINPVISWYRGIYEDSITEADGEENPARIAANDEQKPSTYSAGDVAAEKVKAE